MEHLATSDPALTVALALLDRGGGEAAAWLQVQGRVHEVEQEAIDEGNSTGERVTAAEAAR